MITEMGEGLRQESTSKLVDLLRRIDTPAAPSPIEPLGIKADIYRFRFLPPDQCDQIVSLISLLNFGDSQLTRGSPEGYRTSKDIFVEELDPQVNEAFHAYALPLLRQITKVVWNWECNRLTDVAFLQYGPGCYYKEHIDAAESQLHSLRHISFLVHLSDGYTGGETEFRRQSICVRPMKGRGIVFPSGITHPHEARLVTSGVKYVIAGWLTRA